VNFPVRLVFRDLVVRFRDIQDQPHDIHCKVNENLLNSNERGLSSDENKALYIDFDPSSKKAGATAAADGPSWQAWREAMGASSTKSLVRARQRILGLPNEDSSKHHFQWSTENKEFQQVSSSHSLATAT
jgi:hypothetical protein